ncbi:hypothetical protein [Microbacterium sp. 1262]|uniref:hypothetical protein n=1 Tax=Microbacterium sp. 1262 TaxID=3156415 RepID=UPI003390AFBB
MMTRTASRKRTFVATAALICGVIAFPVQAATAAPSPDDSGETVQEILDSVRAPRTLTASEVAVLEEAGVTQAARNTCQSFKNAVAFSNWQTTTDLNCALIGTNQGTHAYEWAKGVGTPQGASVCIQGRGYRLINQAEPWRGNAPYWRSGCGASGSFVVDWQSAASNTQIKHRTLSAPIAGLGFSWR